MLNNIFDSHSHYDDEKFNDDRDELLFNMKEKGVCGIIHQQFTNGTLSNVTHPKY